MRASQVATAAFLCLAGCDQPKDAASASTHKADNPKPAKATAPKKAEAPKAAPAKADEPKPPAKVDAPKKVEGPNVAPTEVAPTEVTPPKAAPAKEDPKAVDWTKDAALAGITEGDVDTSDAVTLGHMFWAPAQHILGGEYALVLGGTVRDVKKVAADNPETRGEPWVVSARVEVEKTFRSVPLKPEEGSKPESFNKQKFVVVEGANGMSVGDKVIVFGVDYMGTYGALDRTSSNTRVGIKVADWSDPIVGALELVLAGKADLTKKDQIDAWSPYGAAAIPCFVDMESDACMDSL